MPKILFFLLTIFCYGVSFAAELRFSHLGIEQGGIDALTQDKHGFLWVGTRSGLIRYDGSTITTYRNDPDNSATLQEDAITALHYGKDGRLWVGTAENGASYYNYTTGTFTRIATHITGKNAYRFHDDDSGQGVYAQTIDGLFFIDRSGNVKQVLSAKYSELLLGIYSDESGVHGILETGQKFTLGTSPDQPEIYRIIPKTLTQYWQTGRCPHLMREPTHVGDGSGLFYCLRNNQVVDAGLNQALFQAGVNLAQMEVYDLTEDSNGTVWISSDLGLLRIAGDLVTTIRSSGFDGQGLSGNKLSVLLTGQKNTLFVGTQDQGLNILNLENSGLSYFAHEQLASLTENKIAPIVAKKPCQTDETGQSNWSTLQDTEGDLWIGNHTGLLHQAVGSATFKQYHQLGHSEPVDVCSVQALAEADGKIWVGTRRGVVAYDKHKQAVTSYLSEQRNVVRVLLPDRKRGSLWVGTEDSGLHQIDLKSGQIKYFPSAANRPVKLPDPRINSLYLDRNNRLWIGTGAGLSLWNEDSGVFKTMGASDDPTTLSNTTVNAIYQSDPDKLWLGTNNGLNLFSISQFSVEKRWFERDGLPNPAIHRFVPDQYGHYWLGTENGFSRFDPLTNRFSNYYPQHNEKVDGAALSAGLQEKPGRIYLGAKDGLAVVDSQVFANTEKAHLPVITRIDNLDNQNGADKQETQSVLAQMIALAGEQAINKLNRSIRFNFTYPFFGDNDLLKSEYRLLPVNDAWSATSPGAHYVDYAGLQPGAYEFQLKANLAGDQVSRFRFAIDPYFWETLWFKILAFIVLLVLTVFLTIYSYRMWGKFSAEKMTRHHYRIVEHELRPHLHEANKQLQTMLQSPDLTIKDKQTIRFSVMPLINKSIDFIAELRTLVDLRRMVKQPKQLYLLEDILDEVLLFFHDHQHRITISEVEDLNILTHQDAVYLLVKNLISNAIKYSPGGEPVQVNVFRDGSTLMVECLDQGIGISKDKRKAIYEPYQRFAGEYKNINGQGIGLAIVRFIVHTYQGDISITDNQPQGSRFIVRLKGVVADE